MPGGFGKGIDDGKKLVKWIGLIAGTAFILWFLYMGLNLIAGFM